MWYNPDERARDREVLHLLQGLCFINPASTRGKSWHLARETSVKLSDKTLRRIKARIRKVVSRSRGRSLRQIIGELGVYLRGWRAYFGYATGDQFRLLQAWLMRKLRCYQWNNGAAVATANCASAASVAIWHGTPVSRRMDPGV